MKTSWNLGLLYKSDKDPQIEKDMQNIEHLCSVFVKKYKNLSFINSPQLLLNALEDYEKNLRPLREGKPVWYFTLRSHLDTGNSFVNAKKDHYSQRQVAAGITLEFFRLAIASISVSKQKEFLESPLLAPYKYYLQRIFDFAKYNLSEKEEQLSDLLTQTSRTMWVEGQQKYLSQQVIHHKGKDIPIAEALSTLASYGAKDRKILNEKIQETLKSISFFAEVELNAVYNFKKVMDERRGFPQPYTATIMSYQNDEKSIIEFVNFVTKNFHISRRFYRLHAKLLGYKKLSMGDRAVKIGTIKRTFDFPSAVATVRKSLARFGDEYVGIFDSFIKNGQIDVNPKKGKIGGAYSWGNGELPTFVLLNHTNDFQSMQTLAHEMGHSIHTYFSKKHQPPRYQDYPFSTAEVASTLFENILSEEVEQTLTEKERIIMLHDKIMNDVVTIFRQIACFNFEVELHKEIRKNGSVSSQDMAQMMQKHLKSYVGDAFDVTELDGYFYVNWSHIRRHFYVYSYAYGALISSALYQKWKENPSFATQIEKFLSAGGSMSPEDIFKSIGIDTSNMSFFKTGLKAIEKDIDLLEKLTKGKKL